MAQITTLNLTEDEFLNREIQTWGFDHIETLLASGYEPKLTDHGWTWILPVSNRVLSKDRS